MNDGKISVRYARALYNTAKETGCDKEIYEQLSGFAKLFEENMAELNAVFGNPVIGKEERQNLLLTAIGPDIHPCLKDFVSLVIDRHREDKFYLMAKKYEELYREENRILRTQITTAAQLNPATLDEIKKNIETDFNATVEMSETIEPSLIGGFILDVGDKRYDASIAQKLKQLKRELK